MAVEAGLTLAAGAVIGFFTFGSGAAAGAAIAGWRIASAAKKILSTLRALKALAKARAVARLTSVVEKVRPLRKVLARLKSAKRLRKGGKAAKPGGKGPHQKPTRMPGDPLDPATRPPTAGADWEGHVARTGRGKCGNVRERKETRTWSASRIRAVVTPTAACASTTNSVNP